MSWTLLVEFVPALLSVIAAAVAGQYAHSTKRLETDRQRLRDLEQRISEKKYQVYQPIIDRLFRVFLTHDGRRLQEGELQEFDAWIGVYGSDQAVRAWYRLKQGYFDGDAPPMIRVRLYAEFLRAARSDLGYSDSKVTLVELLGTRVADLHHQNGAELYAALTSDWQDLAQRYSWKAPWGDVNK